MVTVEVRKKSSKNGQVTVYVYHIYFFLSLQSTSAQTEERTTT
jgi:hypothetical protein